MPSVLSAKHFHNEQAAYEFLEAKVWPEGPVCPHCGGTERISKMEGKSTRIGAYKCYQCRMQFTVKVGTVFEASHVKLNIWLQAIALLTSSKKGMSSNQLHRILGVTLKTAWFMSHRIREAMNPIATAPMGGAGSIIETDETYFGDKELVTKRTKKGKSGHSGKRIVVALVERDGSARSIHVSKISKIEMSKIIAENINPQSRLHTDESRLYADALNFVAEHDAVYHTKGEYVRGNTHTNTVEGFFSIFKRGMKGVYQHCSEKHLQRYLAEFDFRYSNRVALGVDDINRAELVIKGIVGKRLTYRTIN